MRKGRAEKDDLQRSQGDSMVFNYNVEWCRNYKALDTCPDL